MIDKKINILFSILAPKMGGAERLVYNLIKGIDRDLLNPSLIFFEPGGELDDFKKLGIPIYYTPIRRSMDFHAMNSFASIVRNKKIDIVNSHLFKPFFYSFWGCKIRNQIKLTYTEHSAWEVNKVNLKWRTIGHLLLNRTDKVIGISEDASKALSNIFKLKANKTITIKNGVAIGGVGFKKNSIAIKQELGINPDEKLICMVANYRKVKNHIMLLKAFNLLLKEYHNIRLIFIGQGFATDPTNSETIISDYISKQKLSKKVLLLGYRDDVGEILKIIDIFCLTSLQEGLPISLIEAMAAKLPVIGTNVEGIRDLITESENGFLVELDDVVRLKELLLILLCDNSLRLSFGEKSLKIVADNYSLTRCISNYEKLFYSLVIP